VKTSRIRLALLSLLFLPLTSASATTLVPMDLADLTARAATIVIGTVVDVRSERDGTTISTSVTLADLRVVKGSDPGGTLEVRLAGGTVEGETVRISGMPEFVVGEKNLVFLGGDPHALSPIVGWGQGRFKIRWDAASGQEVVLDNRDVPLTEIRGTTIVRAKPTRRPRGSAGVPVIAAPPASGPAVEPGLPSRLPLESFVEAIEARMGIASPVPASAR
jgi:hypothetical protein